MIPPSVTNIHGFLLERGLFVPEGLLAEAIAAAGPLSDVQPDPVEVVPDGFVSPQRASEIEKDAFAAGQASMTEKADQVREMLDILVAARGLVLRALAWSGDPDDRDVLLARIEVLLDQLR